jgi:hypothetical protein
MVHKPKILYRLIEDSTKLETELGGIGVGYQLSLGDMGGERNVKIHWFANFPEIELDAEFELLLNIEAAQNLVERLNKFLSDNLPTQKDSYQ